MRPLLIVVVLAGFGSACSDSAGSEFTLRGHVVAAQSGMQPAGDIALDEDDANRDDPGEPDGTGVMQVRVTSGGEFSEVVLDECNLDSNAVRVFWTETTDFDPPSAVEGGAFPTILNNRQVDIDGRVFTPTDEDRAAGCTLLADEVQVEASAATSTPAPTTAATEAPEPSPVASPSPTVTPPFETDEVETEEPDETP